MSCARKVPRNYILLSIFTFTEAYIVSYISSIYDPEIVLKAALITCVTVVALTIYAFCTKADFTQVGGFIVCLGAALAMFGLFVMFF